MSASITQTEVAIDEELWFGSPGEDKELEERASQSMAAVAARVLGAKPFPPAARKLEELTRAGGAKIEQVVGVLESDPGLSMRLLRLVNSAGYALRVRCTSVRHAAALVGMRRLHQLATTAAVLDLFETNNPAVKSLLSHAAVVGAFCRYLAVHVDLAPDELFTCGFLHDIGKLMLIDAEGAGYIALVEQAGESPDALHLLEQAKYGFDHAVLGAHVLKNWRIPNPVPRVVAWHHNVARVYQADPSIAAMVQALRLADQLSYLVRTHAEPEGVTIAAQSPAATYLGVSEAQLSSMWQDLSRLSQRIITPGGADQAEMIPREDSLPPSLRPRGKSKLPGVSLPPGASAAPAGPVSEVPKHFVCVVCKKASFGNRCAVCAGHVCAEHQVGAEQWCTECSAAYAMEVGERAFPLWERMTAAGIVVGAGLLSLVVAVLAGRPVLGALFGSVLLSTLCVLLVLVGRRFWSKKVFFQTRARSHAADEPILPLGLSMPPEPTIAMISDVPEVSLRQTDRINPAPDSGRLPALFSVAPTAFDRARSMAPLSAPPPVSAPPPAVSAPPPDSGSPLFSMAAVERSIAGQRPHGSPGGSPTIPGLAPPPATAHDAATNGASMNGTSTHGASTNGASKNGAATNGAATKAAPPATTTPARPPTEPGTNAADAELPQADGWRPVERTEPALPLSRRVESTGLRRLAEALPSIPPRIEPHAHAAGASIIAPTEDIAPVQTVTEVPPRITASCEPAPEPSLRTPVLVPAACKAVAPTLLVACRPVSLSPRHYACSPAGGR